jgi:hypothetical protein
MRVFIDFSIFTKVDGVFGNVSGEIDLAVAPQIGDSISLDYQNSLSVSVPILGFSGVLKVLDRVLMANQIDQKIILALSEVVVPSKIDAIGLASYLESTFDLFVVVYSE